MASISTELLFCDVKLGIIVVSSAKQTKLYKKNKKNKRITKSNYT